MKFSIIVPVFNVEAYLEVSIESVLCQTYKDYEIILIDDGSTDGSGRICDEYCLRYPQTVKVFHMVNEGPLCARIRGIYAATGDVLLFLDSDDALRADALQKILDSFTDECDLLLYNAEPTEEFPSKPMNYPYSDGQIFDEKNKAILYYDIVKGNIPNSVCSKAIRRCCAVPPKRVGEYGMVKHGEDLMLSAHFITNSKKIVYINEGLYHYRIRPGSAVYAYNAHRNGSVKIAHTELAKCIDSWGMPELKPLHNARKVKGWVENLILLLKSRSLMDRCEYKEQLKAMAADPYFRCAYKSMDRTEISYKYRALSFALYYHFFNIIL